MRRTPQPSTTGRAVLLALPVLFLSGCATKGDLRNVRDEIRALTDRQAELLDALQRQSSMTQDSIRGTSDQLLQIRGSVSNQLDRIMDELATIRELSGQNQRAIAGVRDQLEALRRVALMPPPTAEGDVPAGGGVTEPGGGQVADADGMYNAAVVQYNRGSWTAARLAFEQFVTNYPNHDLTPEARFKLADIAEVEGRKQDALRAFLQIPELHPTALKVPDALYRAALLQNDLGDRDEAVRTLERVVNTYPDAAITSLAQEKLREIRR